MNPLAVVGKIVALEPIEGADRIRSATVVCGSSGKWVGVVGLEYSAGDIVTVFLQDAILPPDPRWQFMEKSKWRVKMARFKGSPSECLIMKLGEIELGLDIGTDLTDRLGVTKHFKPIPESMTGQAKGNFPEFIPKTDEENFQRVEDIGRFMSQPWVATLKMDGTSCTVYLDDDGLHVCSRNLELKEFTNTGQGNAYWRAARKYGLERLPVGIALQMEVCGPGIQSNPAGFPELCAFAFKAWDIGARKYLSRDSFLGMLDILDMPSARLVIGGCGELSSDELRKLADQAYPNGKAAEGIVISGLDGRFSFKVINLGYKG